MNFHLARWHFWWGYTVLFLLLAAAMWFNDHAKDAQSVIFYFLSAILLIVLEFVIRAQKISFEKNGFVFVKSGNRHLLHYAEISHISLHQNFLQSFLGYGSITIRKRNGDFVHLKYFENVRKLKEVLSR